MDTRNAAAAANTGRQRADTHSNMGNSSATGATVFQDSSGSEMAIPVMTASAASALAPSMSSPLGGGCRIAVALPITSGETEMMPIASEANQCSHVVRISADGPVNNLYVTAPPI